MARAQQISLVLALISALCSSGARGDSASVTTIGFGMRALDFVGAKRSATDPTKSETKFVHLGGTIVCQEMVGNVRVGVELGAGACAQFGGSQTVSTSTGLQTSLTYLPTVARQNIAGDDSIRLTSKRSKDFFVLGQVGVTKVTHEESGDTNRTLSSDVFEFGAGGGVRGKFNDQLFWSVQGKVLVGAILSNASNGTSYTAIVAPSLNYLF